MVKILYIAGWGRSGTTIVDNVFNTYASVFSTGELFYPWLRAAPPPERRKHCGPIYQRPASSTVHWLIRNALAERLASAFPQRHKRLRYEDFAARPRAVIEGVLGMTGTPANEGPFLDDAT